MQYQCHAFCISKPLNLAVDQAWDVVSDYDLWENENKDLNEDDYVLVREEDIVEGIACFMAAYLMSLEQTKVW